MDLDILLQWIIALSFVSMTIYFSIKARQIEKENPLREENNNK